MYQRIQNKLQKTIQSTQKSVKAMSTIKQGQGTHSIRTDHPEINKHDNRDLKMEVLKMGKIKRFYTQIYVESTKEQN